MLKRFLATALIGVVLNVLCVAPTFANTKLDKQTRFAEKVKNGIATLGTGADARIEVKLKDKQKLKGNSNQVGRRLSRCVLYNA